MNKARQKEAQQEIKAFRKEHAMTTDAVVNLFRKYRPRTLWEVQDMGFKLHKVGEGAFRYGYRIEELPLVGKFPKHPDSEYSEDIEHSNEEAAVIKQIKKNKEYKALHRFMPEVLYHSKKTGIILMPEYTRIKYNKIGNIIVSILTNLVIDLGLFDHDVHHNNIGLKRSMKWSDYPEPVLIDVGILHKYGIY